MNIWQKIGSFVLAFGLLAFANAQERQVTPRYRDAPVRTVLEQVGQLTDSAVVIGKGVEGTVTFQADGPMTVEEFRRTILSHLAGLGYEITERNGVLHIGAIKL